MNSASLLYGQGLQNFFLSLLIKVKILGQQHPSTQGTIQNIENLYKNPEANVYFKGKIAQGDASLIAIMHQAIDIFNQLHNESMVYYIETLIKGYK